MYDLLKQSRTLLFCNKQFLFSPLALACKKGKISAGEIHRAPLISPTCHSVAHWLFHESRYNSHSCVTSHCSYFCSLDYLPGEQNKRAAFMKLSLSRYKQKEHYQLFLLLLFYIGTQCQVYSPNVDECIAFFFPKLFQSTNIKIWSFHSGVLNKALSHCINEVTYIKKWFTCLVSRTAACEINTINNFLH